MSSVSWFGWSLSVEELLLISHLLGVLFNILTVIFVVFATKVHKTRSNPPTLGIDEEKLEAKARGREPLEPTWVRSHENKIPAKDQPQVRFRGMEQAPVCSSSTPANPDPMQRPLPAMPPSPPHQWLDPPMPPSSSLGYSRGPASQVAHYPSMQDNGNSWEGPNADDSRVAGPSSSLAMENPSCSRMEPSLVRSRQEKPLDTFTGTQAELKDYLHHFNIVAELNGWTEAEKGAHLASSLRGIALQILDELPPDERRDYAKVVGALRKRFDPKLESLKRIAFRNRTKERNETVTDYGYALSRLANGAFPKHNQSARDDMVIEQFITGLYNDEIKKHVQYGRPKNLEEAIASAIEFESVEGQTRGRKPEERSVRSVIKDMKEEDKTSGVQSEMREGFNALGELIRKMAPSSPPSQPLHPQAVGSNASDPQNFSPPQNRRAPRPPPAHFLQGVWCYRCGLEGHTNNNCPKPRLPLLSH